jgi:hypothetical protein
MLRARSCGVWGWRIAQQMGARAGGGRLNAGPGARRDRPFPQRQRAAPAQAPRPGIYAQHAGIQLTANAPQLAHGSRLRVCCTCRTPPWLSTPSFPTGSRSLPVRPGRLRSLAASAHRTPQSSLLRARPRRPCQPAALPPVRLRPAAVFDGHGPEGHRVSAFLRRSLPFTLLAQLLSCQPEPQLLASSSPGGFSEPLGTTGSSTKGGDGGSGASLSSSTSSRTRELLPGVPTPTGAAAGRDAVRAQGQGGGEGFEGGRVAAALWGCVASLDEQLRRCVL